MPAQGAVGEDGEVVGLEVVKPKPLHLLADAFALELDVFEAVWVAGLEQGFPRGPLQGLAGCCGINQEPDGVEAVAGCQLHGVFGHGLVAAPFDEPAADAGAEMPFVFHERPEHGFVGRQGAGGGDHGRLAEFALGGVLLALFLQHVVQPDFVRKPEQGLDGPGPDQIFQARFDIFQLIAGHAGVAVHLEFGPDVEFFTGWQAAGDVAGGEDAQE